MEQKTLVPDAGEVVLESVKVKGRSLLLMMLRASGEQNFCPQCHRSSTRVHSHYQRKLSDLPWEGIPVRIQLQVRRFFCDTAGCGQRIFTERLPNTARRYARRTCRLSTSIEQIAWALGGNAGSRLAQQLGIMASGSTFIRQLRRKALPVQSQGPRVLGIDDWAWRKRHRYGTILCDLEQGKVIDLLPERSEKSTGDWMRRHPGTEIVSRDRASLYAEAATRAAPQAVQVADRWHLLHNMSEALIDALAPHHRLLDEVAKATSTPSEAVAVATTPLTNTDTLPRSRRQRMRQQANRERRIALYEAVMEQLRQGATQVDIAHRFGLGLRTIRRWIRAHGFPERKSTPHATKVDLYGEYLRQRWREGCHNASQLWRELCERGFTGQHASVRNWIRTYYGPRSRRREESATLSSATRASPRQTAWLLLKQPEDARPYLEGLCRRSPQIATCASLARDFCRMIRQRDAAMWPRWREEAKNSLLAGFAKHLCRDEAALLAALNQPWSNGPVEGQIHRLKLIKRSMYGRAGFDLLRLRVILLAA
jgi:transposase